MAGVAWYIPARITAHKKIIETVVAAAMKGSGNDVRHCSN